MGLTKKILQVNLNRMPKTRKAPTLTPSVVKAQKYAKSIFKLFGLLSNWVSKEEIVASLPSLFKHKTWQEWQENIPKYVLGNFLELGAGATCAQALTFLRRIARQAEYAVIRKKWQVRIEGKSTTIYYYRALVY
jgi:hypothetical protein